MAAVWDWAINRANEKGWLAGPSESGKFTDGERLTTCKKELGSGNHDPRGGRQVLHATNPVIRDDGAYKHASRPRDDVSGLRTWRGTKELRVWFAQLVNVADAPKGGERDEVIFYSGDYEERLTYFYVNTGGNYDGWSVELKIDDGCETRGEFYTRRVCTHVLYRISGLIFSAPMCRHSLGRCCKYSGTSDRLPTTW